MANRTNFYPDGSTIYQASDFMAPWAALLTPGVIRGYNVIADSPADLAVKVEPGVARLGADGYISRDDTEMTVPIAANTSGYNRLDVIALDVDPANNITTVKDIQGVPSSNPAAPSIGANQQGLALVLVGNNASVINANVITDIRLPSLGPGEYPGKLEPFSGSTPPWNRKIANGSAVSRITCSRLFGIIGTDWGAGDGSTTFNLPDLRHKVFAGYDASDSDFNAIGKTGGSKTQTFGLSNTGFAAVDAEGGLLQISRSTATFMSDVHAAVSFAGGDQAAAFSANLMGTTNSGSILSPYATGNYLIIY